MLRRSGNCHSAAMVGNINININIAKRARYCVYRFPLIAARATRICSETSAGESGLIKAGLSTDNTSREINSNIRARHPIVRLCRTILIACLGCDSSKLCSALESRTYTLVLFLVSRLYLTNAHYHPALFRHNCPPVLRPSQPVARKSCPEATTRCVQASASQTNVKFPRQIVLGFCITDSI